MKIKTFSTVPCEKDPFWQLVIIPTISILRSPDVHEAYTVVNMEWLFWSLSIIIDDDKRNIPSAKGAR